MRWICAAGIMLLASCAAPVPESRTAPPSPTSNGVTRADAVDAALEGVSEVGVVWDLVLAEAGPLAQLKPDWREQDWAQGLSPDVRVWRVVLEAADLSAEVVIDAFDGSVYGSTVGIAN